MREILFRGIPVEGGGFVYGSLVLIGDKAYIHHKSDKEVGTEVLPETVGQYTGAQAWYGCMNRVNVFEGDIISDGPKYVVCFGEFNTKVGYNSYKSREEDIEGIGFYFKALVNRHNPELFTELKSYTVVGNIHQNKELGV